ncbi:MAG: tetratricopeptide repeat protein [Polyangiales bacterium]
MRARTSLAVLGWVAVLSIAALFAYTPIFAVDFFWHLELGELIATTHRIPTTDTFSAVHPERPYVQLQWLWELGAYAVTQVAGLHGIRVAQVVTLVLSVAALAVTTQRALGRAAPAFFVVSLAVLWFEDRMQARPSVTALGFVALSLPLWLADAPVRTPRTLAGIVLLAALWSNLHGGEAVLLPLCLGTRAAGFGWATLRGHEDGTRLRTALLQLVAALLGLGLCPTWLAGMQSWGDAIGPQLATGNQEWLPSYTMLRYGASASHVLIALGPTAVALAYALSLRTVPRPPPHEWMLVVIVCVLAHHAVRNAFLCIVPLTLLLRRAALLRPSRMDVLTASAGVVVLVAALHDHVVDGYGGLAEARHALASDLAPNAFPEELAAFMHEAGIEGPVLNDGRWGGYLIWKLWPRCRVFTDSRQNLTAEMWQVALATQAPDARPAAMRHAFQRWGVELTVFRGPTFPLVHPDGAWQLLFKAGDQELYQHRAGRYAATNLARTRAWLARAGRVATTDDDLARVATEVGAARWLAGPHRRWLADRARTLAASPSPDAQRAGLSITAGLHYDAGDYTGALTALEAWLARAPDDETARYRAALASYAIGRADRARAHLVHLRSDDRALSRHQRERLRVLASALAR